LVYRLRDNPEGVVTSRYHFALNQYLAGVPFRPKSWNLMRIAYQILTQKSII